MYWAEREKECQGLEAIGLWGLDLSHRTVCVCVCVYAIFVIFKNSA